MPVTDVQHDLDALTLTITADFAAPVERVWEVYADPRQLERVWGPPGYPATFVDHDLVPGGRMNYYMTSPEGEKYYAYWDIAAVDQPTSFTFKDGFAVDDSFTANPEMPESSQVFAFADVDGAHPGHLPRDLRRRRVPPEGARHGRRRGVDPGDQPDRRPARCLTRAADPTSPDQSPTAERPPSCDPSSSPSSSASTASSSPPAAATTRTPAGPSRTSSSTRRPTRSRAGRWARPPRSCSAGSPTTSSTPCGRPWRSSRPTTRCPSTSSPRPSPATPRHGARAR